jgi:arsenical pump membrane protein
LFESSPTGGVDRHLAQHLTVMLALAGVLGFVIAMAVDCANAQAAASQDWPPFVLVTGLLLVGLVADGDGLFAAVGQQLARTAKHGAVLFFGTSLVIGVVTALLNLDTSVAFLTPVLVYTAKSRNEDETPLLCAVLLLSNAGSLFLTGSNLTNLIVLNHYHLSGAAFLSRMWAPALVSFALTALVIAIVEHRAMRQRAVPANRPERFAFGLGFVAVVITTALVVSLRDPALPVLIVGVITVAIKLTRDRGQLHRVIELLSLPTLVGLFGIAVALGTLGRAWSGPATLMSHLNLWETAPFAAISAIVVNNLPAASLLAARVPPHPFSLLIGLNLGPNLFMTGSLSWLLWIRAARTAGAEPAIAKTSRIGLVAVPIAMAAALGVLVLTGSS